MFRVLASSIAILACWKWGAWKRWKDYYPTILYVIIGDLIYNFVFYNHTLWKYESFINHTLSNLFNAATIFPSMIILYFTHWPTARPMKVLYILFFSIGCSLIEYASKCIGFFSYENGWNIFWSFGVYFGAFILIRLHYKHPLVVWPISCLLGIITAFVFGLPFGSMK